MDEMEEKDKMVRIIKVAVIVIVTLGYTHLILSRTNINIQNNTIYNKALLKESCHITNITPSQRMAKL
jgi:sugar phosphate permease